MYIDKTKSESTDVAALLRVQDLASKAMDRISNERKKPETTMDRLNAHRARYFDFDDPSASHDWDRTKRSDEDPKIVQLERQVADAKAAVDDAEMKRVIADEAMENSHTAFNNAMKEVGETIKETQGEGGTMNDEQQQKLGAMLDVQGECIEKSVSAKKDLEFLTGKWRTLEKQLRIARIDQETRRTKKLKPKAAKRSRIQDAIAELKKKVEDAKLKEEDAERAVQIAREAREENDVALGALANGLVNGEPDSEGQRKLKTVAAEGRKLTGALTSAMDALKIHKRARVELQDKPTNAETRGVIE